MAEAAVEETLPQRFYCHMCNIKFESTSPTFTCPRCSDGFVEQLEANGQNSEAGDPFMSDSDEESFYQVGFDEYFIPQFRRAHGSRMQRPLTRIATSNLRQQSQTFENLIHEFIANLGVNVISGNGNMQLFLGNPGDYAWGREGLDAIVTQLLNQMDTNGPPPLAKDVIDAIPFVEVNQDQVDAKLQCSVCWEDFQLNEKVRQLACQHVFHEPCIRPWLELHGTCPICRQDLGSEEQSSNSGNDNSGGTYNTLQQLFQAVQSSQINLSSSSSGTSGDASSTSTSNSVNSEE